MGMCVWMCKYVEVDVCVCVYAPICFPIVILPCCAHARGGLVIGMCVWFLDVCECVGRTYMWVDVMCWMIDVRIRIIRTPPRCVRTIRTPPRCVRTIRTPPRCVRIIRTPLRCVRTIRTPPRCVRTIRTPPRWICYGYGCLGACVGRYVFD